MKPVKAVYFTVKNFFILHILIALILGLIFQEILPILMLTTIIYVVGLLIAFFVGSITHLFFIDSKLEIAISYVTVGFMIPFLLFWLPSYSEVDAFLFGAVLGVYGALWAYVFWQSICQQKSVKESKEDITVLSHPSTG